MRAQLLAVKGVRSVRRSAPIGEGKTDRYRKVSMLSSEKLAKELHQRLGTLSDRIPDALAFLCSPPRLEGWKAIESGTLANHYSWALRAGDDQVELEKVVKSLQKNPLVGCYRDWCEAATP
jgi:hypothetical protein